MPKCKLAVYTSCNKHNHLYSISNGEINERIRKQGVLHTLFLVWSGVRHWPLLPVNFFVSQPLRQMSKPVAVSSKSSAQQSSTCVWPLGVGASGRCWHLAPVPAYFLTHLPLNLITRVPLLRWTCCLRPAGKASVLRVDPGTGPGLCACCRLKEPPWPVPL